MYDEKERGGIHSSSIYTLILMILFKDTCEGDFFVEELVLPTTLTSSPLSRHLQCLLRFSILHHLDIILACYTELARELN